MDCHNHGHNHGHGLPHLRTRELRAQGLQELSQLIALSIQPVTQKAPKQNSNSEHQQSSMPCIHDYTSLYIIIHDYTWLYIIIYHYTSLDITIHHYTSYTYVCVYEKHMSVCMHGRAYGPIYVMYVWMSACMSVFVNVYMYVLEHLHFYACVSVCLYVSCMYECMYACVHAC